MTTKSALLMASAFAWLPTAGWAKAPDCSGPARYPAMEVYVGLKNAGLLSGQDVDFKRARSNTITSQQIGQNLWKQVFHVTWPLKSGKVFEAIVVEDVSDDECSMSKPQIFLVSQKL